jgi:hypothetical protein
MVTVPALSCRCRRRHNNGWMQSEMAICINGMSGSCWGYSSGHGWASAYATQRQCTTNRSMHYRGSTPHFVAGRGYSDSATRLPDGRCWVLLPRAATPRGGGTNCHDQQAANAFQMQDGLRKSPQDVLQPTAARTWGILPTTAELVPAILFPSYT